MNLIKERILKEFKVCPGNVLKVGSLLNHQIDIDFLFKMGEEISNLFNDCEITKILTVEASGIALACATAHYLKAPVLVARKTKSSYLSDDLYLAEVKSFTHSTTSDIFVEKLAMSQDDKILIIDDFLAYGEALKGLISLVEQSGAEVVGCGIAIEKGFQNGGDFIRLQGYNVKSLAIVQSMTDDGLTFRD